MKKILILTLLAALMGTGKMMAQNNRLAELRHDGDITYFYGSNALKNAHEAAQNGDTITLSPGTFSAVKITKAILLRGAYMEGETLIVGDFSINISDGEGSLFQMEDLEHNQSNLTITKVPPMSRIQRCRLGGNVTVNDEITFTMCRINVWDQTIYGNAMKNLYHCSFMMTQINGSSSKKHWNVINCNVYCKQYYYNKGVFQGMEDAVFYNCIFHEDASFKDYDNYPENTSGAEFYNCIATGTGNFFGNLADKHGSQNVSADMITGGFGYERLTEEADSIYLGFDGKPVGMYGGSVPFDPTPAYPRITKFEVAPKAINGTLRVNVEVNGEE